MIGVNRTKENFYSVLKTHQNLISLKINNCCIQLDEAKAIGKVLADFKFIKELDISNSNL